jgi:hypothetical protein
MVVSPSHNSSNVRKMLRITSVAYGLKKTL